MTRSQERVEPRSRSEWGRWLAEHHAQSSGVWLRIDARNAPGGDALSYENAVRELLCWGWVDGQARRDGEASLVWCCPRRPSSGWAATNKARVAELTAQGRMQEPGLAAVEVARANGAWSVLDGPEAGIEPQELTAALDAVPRARSFWDDLPPSARTYALSQIAFAKREATRTSRIDEVVRRCAEHERPDR